MIFGMRCKSKKYVKESELPGWNDRLVWKDFRPPYISNDVLFGMYLSHNSHISIQRIQTNLLLVPLPHTLIALSCLICMQNRW